MPESQNAPDRISPGLGFLSKRFLLVTISTSPNDDSIKMTVNGCLVKPLILLSIFLTMPEIIAVDSVGCFSSTMPAVIKDLGAGFGAPPWLWANSSAEAKHSTKCGKAASWKIYSRSASVSLSKILGELNIIVSTVPLASPRAV